MASGADRLGADDNAERPRALLGRHLDGDHRVIMNGGDHTPHNARVEEIAREQAAARAARIAVHVHARLQAFQVLADDVPERRLGVEVIRKDLYPLLLRLPVVILGLKIRMRTSQVNETGRTMSASGYSTSTTSGGRLGFPWSVHKMAVYLLRDSGILQT
jgi:hypothetical protein